MNAAAAPARRFRSSYRAFLVPGTRVTAILAAVLLAAGALLPHAGGALPWQAALAIAGLTWLGWLIVAGLSATQQVRIHDDGRIVVRGVGTGFRRRGFAAGEVQSAGLLQWPQVRSSPAGHLVLQLRPAAHRGWNRVAVIDTHPFNRSDGALFQAVLAAVASVQPRLRLPVVDRAGNPC
ncbi:hypothetical protein OK348_07410 [Flavobacterium sp. MXW15]|uniref:PH domain-containing protein n=1 Tax=Xanthomonas chitinilytica TaxID=2989819 RepID=A0ABT3JTP7_9XANT|nr:hypothetical protein [Xanthomonas sp. H13-6]MCW4454622.1 hypothetical protein [Flavobacterium sp. MXW15]MCW4471861.1 hypothetical protein [Xanthomonas sp. H13-6]